MALTSDELLLAKVALVPLMVPVLRQYRAQNVSDPVAQMKTNYQTLSGTALPGKARLMKDLFGTGADISACTLDPGDFNACVDVAALQL